MVKITVELRIYIFFEGESHSNLTVEFTVNLRKIYNSVLLLLSDIPDAPRPFPVYGFPVEIYSV